MAEDVNIAIPPYGQGDDRAETVTVTASGERGKRRFELSTSAPQRDNGPQRRTVTEANGPFVTTGSVSFDALFALAVDDGRQASVESIKDDAYNQGEPIPCRCFETGEQWHYVWTRDLAYALDLGLAGFDPERGVNGLLFKTSGLRSGVPVPPELPAGSRQIVQDTGSGGSWPVSTDRVAWALGAERILANLEDDARRAFARQAYQALRGTLEADRIAAFDSRDGLYGGEHSFLDWREQTYAPWIVDNLSAMAQMKALSTNILQYRAMRLAARLAREQGDEPGAIRYEGWADALLPAIRRTFWNEDAGLFGTYVSADVHPYPIAKYDLLGNALAILSGVADDRQARTILSRYPWAPFGPPVVWPQAPGEFVYHNRAQWPFVTAYALRAAARAGHVAAADRAMDSLMRGAALHLSNMENLEWLTGRSRFDDGPEINSRRQLWSIGAYYGAVVNTLFGWQPEPDGVHVAPFLTSHVRRLLGDRAEATLGGLRWGAREVEITLELPPQAADGARYPVRSVTLNGRPAPERIAPGDLQAGLNRVRVSFGAPQRSPEHVTEAPRVPPFSHDDPRAFMPATPVIVAELHGDGTAIRISGPARPQAVRYTVLRDGRVVARDVAGPGWTDRNRPVDATVCYSVIATFTGTKLASQPSASACVRGRLAQTITMDDPRLTTDAERLPAGTVPAPTIRLALGKRATVRDILVERPGLYAVSLSYDNHVGPLNTGVTNAVKRLVMTGADGQVQGAVVQMPHIRPQGQTHPLRLSTRAYLKLAPGRYRLDISDFLNMSALESNATYTGAGGQSGPVNQARIAAIHIDPIAP